MVDTLFLGIAVLTIVSAIAALEMRSLIYGGIALMGTLGGIAGFFHFVRFAVCSIVPDCCVCGFYCCTNFVYYYAGKERINLSEERGSKAKVCWNRSYVDNNDLLRSSNIQFRSFLHDH